MDDKIGTMYFPTLIAPANRSACDVSGCSGTSIGSYKSKNSNSTGAVSASAAIKILSASFHDEGQCCDPLDDPTCDD